MATPLVFCGVCIRQISGNAKNVIASENAHQCMLCFGIMDQAMIDEVGERVQKELKINDFDSNSFVLALNLPIAQTLRELLISRSRSDFDGTLVSVPFKVRNIDGYLKKLESYSGKRPTLSSDLHVLITFVQEETNAYDYDFLKKKFPKDFCLGKRKRYANNELPEQFSKQQLQQVASRITADIARDYFFTSPTRKCSFTITFERDPVFIAGRYCKYSRNLPQSPWSEEKDAPREPGNSVSEKICDVLKKWFGASESKFVTSGREDIDVRMLGTGRPFVVELRNCRKTELIRGVNYINTLKVIENEINADIDIHINSLLRVTRDVAERLCMGEEDKRKQYFAHCYSILPISEEKFKTVELLAPITIIQKTPVRVMKRRTLLDRERTIYSLDFLKLDDHHFSVRLETQAGTYIKEFVHGDFGRTRMSLAEILDVAHGEVDILELDVENVDVIWPPAYEESIKFR